MAQIGSPPAGWYTDPSGQHHARYWDGETWTEQVRDDLAPSTPGQPGAVPAPNPMAETVANVAEAVAAVAANDLTSGFPGTSGTGEPPLVVDYGSEGAWGATPAPGETAPVGFDPSASAAASATFDPFAATPDPSPVPMTASPAMPAAAWYPDPAARHQARLWDGTRWTERVADYGQEGVDPLPGLATTSATGWVSGGALGAADASTAGSVSDPTFGAGVGGAASGGGWGDVAAHSDQSAVGPDGKPLSAGQISLASLPDIDPADLEPAKARSRPTAKVRVAGGFVFAGAVALVVGSTMTWMDVTGPLVGDERAATGVDLGDGRITVVLGVVLALLGVLIMTGRMARFGGPKVAAMGALVAGAAATAVTAVDIADVADRAARLGVPAGAVSNVGTGLWVAFVGALFAVGGGLMAFANRQ